MDESVAVMDTVDGHFGKQWMENLGKALQGRTPDYLVIQHMEPDHSASIPLFMEKYPDAVIVATPAAFKMMKQFFGEGFTGRQLPRRTAENYLWDSLPCNFCLRPWFTGRRL